MIKISDNNFILIPLRLLKGGQQLEKRTAANVKIYNSDATVEVDVIYSSNKGK